MPTLWFALLLAGAGLLVALVIYLLLRASAEEAARADREAEAWLARAAAHRERPVRGPWAEDDDAA